MQAVSWLAKRRTSWDACTCDFDLWIGELFAIGTAGLWLTQVVQYWALHFNTTVPYCTVLKRTIQICKCSKKFTCSLTFNNINSTTKWNLGHTTSVYLHLYTVYTGPLENEMLHVHKVKKNKVTFNYIEMWWCLYIQYVDPKVDRHSIVVLSDKMYILCILYLKTKWHHKIYIK